MKSDTIIHGTGTDADRAIGTRTWEDKLIVNAVAASDGEWDRPANGTALDDEGARKLRDELDAYLNRPKPQHIRLEVIVPAHWLGAPVNVFQLKNHVRKYVAQDRAVPKESIVVNLLP